MTWRAVSARPHCTRARHGVAALAVGAQVDIERKTCRRHPGLLRLPRCSLLRRPLSMSTIETMRRLGVNPKPTDTLLCKAHVITTTYLRRLCHSRRAVEATTMGTHGICTRLIAAMKTLRRAAYSSRKRPDKRRG